MSDHKAIFVPFTAGQAVGPPKDGLTGFAKDKGESQGRRVGVVGDRVGALLLADDVGIQCGA